MVHAPGQTGISVDLLTAGVRTRQARVMGEVVDESLERMAEHRERRAEERAEREREEDRLAAIDRRERADAEAAVRRHERREAYYEDLAGRGDEWAATEADRERGEAEEIRLRSRLDVRG